MKINGNSDGGGGSLTPQQEALINQVPNKVDQVRLVTDGSVIRHEGALQALTFNQIYELVMDNSKYVYIVMDNNIRFRPSAYDGDAIWFDSSFIEEGKPNILRCIINSSNVVSIDQIVVASEDYVQDYVDEHGGGLTPEQQEALEPMFNTKGGVLKTTEYKANKFLYNVKNNLQNNYNYSSNEETVPYEYWFKDNEYGKVGVFNPTTLEIEYYRFNSNSFNGSFFWKDNSGRLYYGSYELNLDELTMKQKIVTGSLITHNYVPSIFRFGDEILNIFWNILIFNEETQDFENCEVTGGFVYPSEVMKYKGDIVSFSRGIKLVKVSDKSYKWESWTPPFNTTTEDGQSIQLKHIHYVNGIGYFFIYDANPNNVYKLEGTEWVKFDVELESFDGQVSTSSVGKFLIFKDYESFSLLTLDDVKSTTWSDISSEYVTLNTNQTIKGQKTFDWISSTTGRIERIDNVKYLDHSYNEDLTIGLDNKKLNVEGKSINLNGVELPTKNDLYINSEAKVGDGFVKLSNTFVNLYNAGKLGDDVFATWGGTTARKWNGTDWEYVELPFEFQYPSDFKDTTSHSVYIDNSNNIWEYVGGEFILIDDSGRALNSYPIGDKLVKSDTNLYFDFNTNSWVEGSVTFKSFATAYIKVIGGITYYNEYGDLYKIEDDGNITHLGSHVWMEHPENYFEYDGDAYFVSYDGVYKFVKETNEFIKTDFYFKSFNNLYFEYNGKLYLSIPQEGGIGLVQVTEYTKPEVPAGDGNYVLRATRVGDKITYSWVSE